MRQGQIRITKSAAREIHARSVTKKGEVAARCCRTKSDYAQNLIVTGNAARVSCPRCKGLVQ